MRELKKLLIKEKERLEEIVIRTKMQLNNTPKGTLRLSQSNSHVQFYHCTVENKKGKYIAKGNEKLVIVGGALSTGVLSVDEIKTLASIPSLDELRAKIIGLLQAPGAQLARVTKAYSEKEAA